MKKLTKFFLQLIAFFVIWALGFFLYLFVGDILGIWETPSGTGMTLGEMKKMANNVGLKRGIYEFFAFAFKFPIVAYGMAFSKAGAEVRMDIWKWVDENILNGFSNNNSISTSQRNEAIGYLKQGNNEYRKGKFNEAIKYYTKAIEIDSNFKEAYRNRDKARKKL